MAPRSFALDPARVSYPDDGLAELLRRAGGDHSRMAGLITSVLGNSVDRSAGVVPHGAVDLIGVNTSILRDVYDALAAEVADARSGGHPAAGALASVADQWAEMAGIDEAPLVAPEAAPDAPKPAPAPGTA
jgi:hypothetical protein